MLWSAFRDLIRRTLLSDQIQPPDPDTGIVPPTNWSDDQLADAMRLALDAFARHTARKLTVTYGNGGTVPVNLETDRTFTLPEEALDFEPLEECACVVLVTDSVTTQLEPLECTPGIPVTSEGFYSPTPNTITINATATSNSVLHVTYYAYYEPPVADTDPVQVPRWAHAALVYLVAAHCMTSVSVASANINQWKVKQDSGNPEHNAFRAQQRWFMELYERELARFARQERNA
jgi:hypothetical protein